MQVDRSWSNAARSGGELGGVFVTENANCLLKLLDLERLFQNRNWATRQNPIEHFAVGVTGDNDNRQFRVGFLRRIVSVSRGAVRQFQIEKKKIELLFFKCYQRFLDGADNNAAESDFLEKNFKQTLEAFIVVDDKHGGLTGFVFLQDVLVERRFFNPPASPNLDRGKLSALD